MITFKSPYQTTYLFYNIKNELVFELFMRKEDTILLNKFIVRIVEKDVPEHSWYSFGRNEWFISEELKITQKKEQDLINQHALITFRKGHIFTASTPNNLVS